MTPGDWIAIAAAPIPFAGVGVKLISGMAKLVDAVERLTIATEKIAGQVQDHEKRLDRLEWTPRRRRVQAAAEGG